MKITYISKQNHPNKFLRKTPFPGDCRKLGELVLHLGILDALWLFSVLEGAPLYIIKQVKVRNAVPMIHLSLT